MQSLQNLHDTTGNLKLHCKNVLTLRQISKKLLLQHAGKPVDALQLKYQEDNIRAHSTALRVEVAEAEEACKTAVQVLAGQTHSATAQSLHSGSRLVTLASVMRQAMDQCAILSPKIAVEQEAILKQQTADLHRAALELREIAAEIDGIDTSLATDKMAEPVWQNAIDSVVKFALKKHTAEGTYSVPKEMIQ